MNALRLLLLACAECMLLAGCRVSEHKDGRNKNVEIGTPFGSMHVKTNDNANVAGLGITPYPGAVPDRDEKTDGNAADVNMSFGDFHLGVRAASYRTGDSEDKVVSFYHKELSRYGEVLQCRGSHPEGQPAKTAQGLTCDDNNGSHRGHVNVRSGLELRAGSPQHQHIVSIDPKGDGIKIGLVSLDLPGGHHDSEDTE
ncbi:MAG TPA: hypothetical protein VM865_03365 [Acidobacteriaceae bacterium]|nr:hypothetical protein [Acidobacteriaceae bacterium]